MAKYLELMSEEMKATVFGLCLSAGLLAIPLMAADKIIINANIFTVNPTQPWADAMVITDGVVEYVGTNRQAREYLHMEAELVDLNGKLLLPGFIDVHMHPSEVYASPQEICILRGGKLIEQHIKRIENCIDKQQDEDWFLAWGHGIDDIIDSPIMPKTLLDEIIPDKPAVIFALSSHSNWINSAALEKIGWDSETPNPAGGIILKDLDSGEPTGILFDNAADIVNELIYKPTTKALDNAYYGFLQATADLSAHGITSIADARVYWTQKHHQVWQRIEQENALKTRMVLHLWAYPQMDDSQIDTLKSLYSNDPNSLLRISGIKTYADGLIGNTTAALKAAYSINYRINKDNTGINYFDQQRLTKFISELAPVGFNFMIHAIGDRGVHESLNAIETAQKINEHDYGRRHRITHLDLIDDVDLPRFKQLGVVADFQFAANWTHPHEYNPYASIFIKDRIKYVYRVRDLYDDGVTVTLSSDFDVSDMYPLLGIQNSITRDEQQLPSLEAAIKAYTLNAAFALSLDHITGSIEVGKYADLIVLDKNIFELPETEISEAKVLWTLLGGEEMYRHKDW